MGTSADELRAYMTGQGYETCVVHPESGEIIQLTPDQHVVSNCVFNLVFRHPVSAAVAA